MGIQVDGEMKDIDLIHEGCASATTPRLAALPLWSTARSRCILEVRPRDDSAFIVRAIEVFVSSFVGSSRNEIPEDLQ